MKISDRIKQIRISKNMSTYDLAELTGISQSTISKLENGKRKIDIDVLEKISTALGTSLTYLTRKSAKAIIEDRLEELNMTFEDLSNKTKIPVAFFDKLDDIIPDECDFNQVQRVARALNMYPSVLVEALYMQQPPLSKETIEKWDENSNIIKEQVALYEAGEFNEPKSAMAFLIKQPSLAAYGGYDPKTMSDEEIVEFANELLRQLKLLGFKYKK